MKRRTLDLLASAGGLLVASLLLVAGIVLNSNATFARNYVADQLGDQKITFATLDRLTDEEKTKPCLVQYAGQLMTTGKQAECYANNYIALHLSRATEGRSYAELGDEQRTLRAELQAAQAANAPNVAELQAKLDAVTAARETAFQGESLRGMLLTSYGFSELGNKAGQFATVAFIGAGLMVLLSAAGFYHAYRTPPTVAFAPVERPNGEPANR